MSNALNWFEIPVTDLARAKELYSRILQADLREESLSGRSMVDRIADLGVLAEPFAPEPGQTLEDFLRKVRAGSAA